MIEVPLEILNVQGDGFHLLVEVVVFDTVFKAVLDTGASRTVFDKNTVEEYVDAETLLLSDRLSTGLGTDSMESYTLVIPELRIGRLSVSNFDTAVLDLSMINNAYQRVAASPIIGVVGGDILMAYGAVIDYNTPSLSFVKDA